MTGRGAPADRLRPALLRDMEAKGIDAALSLEILDDWNGGLYADVAPVRATGVPAVDGRSVVPIGPETALSLPVAEAASRLSALDLALPAEAPRRGGMVSLDRDALAAIGESLYPRAAYGLLNGGSATSYADRKKNLAFGEEAFEAVRDGFEALAPLCKDRPKGLTPAYLEPDGSPGESFLVLKLRARLLAALRARERLAGRKGAPPAGGAILPLFQMSSTGSDAELAAAYRGYGEHPFLAPLADRLGLPAADFATGVQPMIAAYTHSSEGEPRRIFDRAWGRADSTLALPGGHGQCFRVLAPVLGALRASGVRFAWIGNVDNLGYLPDPVELAVFALSGAPAAFDFSWRTPVDVKGGILVETAGPAGPEGAPGATARTIADIGPAVSLEEVARLEAGGASILFNCAIGLFDLDYLVPRIEELGRRLPLRFTDQDKDSGRYSQAEQVTWEIASLLPGFLSFAVDKYERFIAAKLLAETLITSGLGSGARAGRGGPRLPPAVAETAARLHAGLERVLSGPCGLVLEGGRWRPRAD